MVRSEGWFVFALMARYPEGAQCISDLMHDVAVFQPLVEMLTGKSIVDYKPNLSGSPSSGSPGQSSASPPTTFSSAGPSPGLTFEGHTPESVQPSAQAAELARIDRENALVLVSELLKNRGEQMAVLRRTLFEDLLKGGGEIVMSYREAAPTWGDKPVPRAGLNLQEASEQSIRELI